MDQEINSSEHEDLEGLPTRAVGPFLMQKAPRKRLELILSCRDPEAAVAALPEEDFLFTVMEIGPDDSLPLLALARVEQLNLIFDLEWWKRESLVPAKALQWLERLEGASAKKLLEWLYQTDFELLVSLFKKWTRVSIIQDDVDPLEARETLPPNSLDDQYFWAAQYPQYEALIGRVLRLLFEVNQGFYRELLNHVLWSLEAEVEEDAYRFHRGRLEDRAIPDYYDALTIYGAVGSRSPGIRRKARIVDFETSAPSFALSLVVEDDFLHRVLQAVEDPALLDTLRLELASIANKVMVADGLSPDSPESLHLAVQKSAAWVSIGLESVSQGDVRMGVRDLSEIYLEDLFRRGHEAVGRVQQGLQRLIRSGWIARWPEGMNILDDPWHADVEHLLEKTPRLIGSGRHALKGPSEGLIRTLADVKRARGIVEAISAGGYLLDLCGVGEAEVGGWHFWREGQIRDLADVTIGSLVWTAAARFLDSGAWVVEPLEPSQWTTHFDRYQPDRLAAVIRNRVESQTSRDSQKPGALAYLEPLLQAYADEMSSFSGGNPPDPGMTMFFLFAER